MNKRIAILHYASPPTVGGVEQTIAYHARGLADLGYRVRVISGSGGRFDERVEVVVYPLFASKHPQVLEAKHSLDAGIVPDQFDDLVARQRAALSDSLKDCDVCIVHNVHTLNKNLALTVALSQVRGPQFIAWCHDLAWTNPQYLPELHPRQPWTLLRAVWPDTRYVTVSEARRHELAELLGIDPSEVAVVFPGVDPALFFQWTPTAQAIVARLGLLDADGLLLLPARLTRRKNIALGLRVLADLRARSGRDFRLIVTGPPGPHNPTNPGYLGELLALRQTLGLEASAHFLYELEEPPLVPDDATMANLYQLADALFFPSVQEGFGIPVVEAGWAGLPVFCADIPPLRHTGQADAVYFDPVAADPAAIANTIVSTLDALPSFRLKVRARQRYRWQTIIKEQVVPLLEEK